jgi:predicted PurR-regulated permease PerM
VVICVAINPLHMRLRRRWSGASGRVALAALLTLLVALAILVPLIIGIAQAALTADARLIGSNVLRRLVTLTFTLFALFFLLRDRDALIE